MRIHRLGALPQPPPRLPELRLRISLTAMAGKWRISESFAWPWFGVAAAVGVAVEILIVSAQGGREAWDSELYWKASWTAMIAASFLGAFFARRDRVAIGYAPFLAQFITMMVRTGGGSLWPLGLIIILVIGLTGLAAAFVGAFLGKEVLGKEN